MYVKILFRLCKETVHEVLIDGCDDAGFQPSGLHSLQIGELSPQQQLEQHILCRVHHVADLAVEHSFLTE